MKKINWNKPIRMNGGDNHGLTLLVPPKNGVHGAFVRFASGTAREVNDFGETVSELWRSVHRVENVPEVVVTYDVIMSNGLTLEIAKGYARTYPNSVGARVIKVTRIDDEITSVELVSAEQ